tara:strand:- start:1763 stop:2029 length:267 start_codon:yes stop_codon:yes gene_type:complete
MKNLFRVWIHSVSIRTKTSIIIRLAVVVWLFSIFALIFGIFASFALVFSEGWADNWAYLFLPPALFVMWTFFLWMVASCLFWVASPKN